MSKNLVFDFSVNKENNTITVIREFAAELSLVWDAYTKSEILDQWWAPKPFKTITKKIDFRDGGHWHYSMVGPNGEEYWAWSEFKKVQIQKSFIRLDAFADAHGNLNKEFPQSEWEIIFTSKGQVTLVEIVISYSNLAQLEATIQMGFKEGFSMAMDGLSELFPSLKNKQ